MPTRHRVPLLRALLGPGPVVPGPLVMAVLVVLVLAVPACTRQEVPAGAAPGVAGGAAGGASGGATGGRRITVAGDSISVGLGTQLRDLVGDRATVKVIGEAGTGLARPDRFDWPARLEQLARDVPPTVLVFSVGSNDAQDLTGGTGEVVATLAEDPAWDAEYSRRLARVFDAFKDTGTTVVWVGHVRTRETRVGETNRHIHRLAQEVAAGRPWVRVADLGQLLGTGERTATTCLLPDGLHLNDQCLTRAGRGLLPLLLAWPRQPVGAAPTAGRTRVTPTGG